MRNVAVLFITQERLRAEIFIDPVRTFKGLKGSVDSEEGFHLQEEPSSSYEESASYKGGAPGYVPAVGCALPPVCFVITGKKIVSHEKVLEQHRIQGAVPGNGQTVRFGPWTCLFDGPQLPQSKGKCFRKDLPFFFFFYFL